MNKSIENYIEKLLNESTPTSPIWNVEILRGKEPGWNYIDGCMISTLIELNKTTKEQKYIDFILNFVDYYVSKPIVENDAKGVGPVIMAFTELIKLK